MTNIVNYNRMQHGYIVFCVVVCEVNRIDVVHTETLMKASHSSLTVIIRYHNLLLEEVDLAQAG